MNVCEYTYEWRHTGVHATVYVQVQRKSCEKIARDECEVRWGGSHFCFEGKARISDMHTALVMPEATALRRPGASTGEEDRFLTTNLDAPSMPPGEEQGQPWRIWQAASRVLHPNGSLVCFQGPLLVP